MAASVASSSSTGERSPDRKASTREQASPVQGASGMDEILSRQPGPTRMLALAGEALPERLLTDHPVDGDPQRDAVLGDDAGVDGGALVVGQRAAEHPLAHRDHRVGA